ncbi:MAG: GTP 3',8-cyclase MoaA [Suipraeoptans sp.]
MNDKQGRNIDYMRISITDRCNLRCKYCMPDGIEKMSMDDILTFEEIIKVCKAAVSNGIKNIKITGGEPLARRGCTDLVASIKKLHGIETVTLTTNGVMLTEHLDELMASGIDGINISLDSVDEAIYKRITGNDSLSEVLCGFKQAMKTHIPIKINTVLITGINDNEWENIILLARDYPVDVRFIEMMPIGYGKDFNVVSNIEILNKLKDRYVKTTRDLRRHGNGPAAYYNITGFKGSIGFISAIHAKFCDECNRIRLTATGQLKPCLCYGEAIDLREILRSQNEHEDELLKEAVERAILSKPGEHCFEAPEVMTEEAPMAQIGG